jgi:hypothetical protein
LFGCIILGLIQLISIGLDLTQCLDSDFLFLPVLQFIFVFLLMHFILLQTKQSQKYFYNNIAIAHLLATQLSIWLGHYQPNRHFCGYVRVARVDLSDNNPPTLSSTQNFTNHTSINPFMKRMLDLSVKSPPNSTALSLNASFALDSNATSSLLGRQNTSQASQEDPLTGNSSENSFTLTQLASSAAVQLASNVSSSFSDLLLPVMQHYQLLVIFILITIWLNNNRVRPNHLRPRLGDNNDSANVARMADQEFAGAGFLASAGRLQALKGFFLGMLIIAVTIIVLVLGDDYITLITHSTIQCICALVSLVALFVRGRKRKGLHKLPVKYFDPNEFHLFVVISFTSAYFCALCAILLNLLQPEVVSENLFDSVLLLVQITLQTLLLRTDGRKVHKLREFYGFLIVSNFSLWVLEVTEISSLNSARNPIFNLNILPQILVSLNRFYSALVFIHFWQTK